MLPKKIISRLNNPKRYTLTPSKGFTLIELLVVMAVLSILIGIGVNTFTIAQKKARDTKRKADMRQVRTALEAYRINANGAYPSTDPTQWVFSSLPSVLTTTYISTLPTDPLNNSNCSYSYASRGNASDRYLLAFCLEDNQDKDGKGICTSDPSRGTMIFCRMDQDGTYHDNNFLN